jgi:hypothetical protein
MQVKSIISALALSLTLAVAGPAFAQTTINGTVISAEDLPKVQARCDEIATSAKTASTANDQTDGGDTNTGDSAASADATTTDTPQVDQADKATTTFDLDTLDAAACAQLPAK